MLPYGLAIAVGLSSSIFFLTAFFMPKIHRQDDFVWSGLGFFYALILWFCAAQFTNALLLGQLVVVALLISYSWQVINLRKAVVSPGEQKNLDGFSLTGFIGGVFNRNPQAGNPTTEKVEEVAETTEVSETSQAPEETNEEEETDSFPIIPVTEDVAEENIVDDILNAVEETTEEITPEAPESQEDVVVEKSETTIQAEESNIVSSSEEDPNAEITTAPALESESSSTIPEKTEKKPGLFNKIFKFGNKEQKSKPENKQSITNTKLDELLDNAEEEVKSDEVPAAIAEPPVKEPEVEESTNWDFLDDEPEKDSLPQESGDESPKVTTETSIDVDLEKPSSDQESD